MCGFCSCSTSRRSILSPTNAFVVFPLKKSDTAGLQWLKAKQIQQPNQPNSLSLLESLNRSLSLNHTSWTIDITLLCALSHAHTCVCTIRCLLTWMLNWISPICSRPKNNWIQLTKVHRTIITFPSHHFPLFLLRIGGENGSTNSVIRTVYNVGNSKSMIQLCRT